MSMSYIRNHYGVPAKRGARVLFGKKPGVITGSVGAYLRIRLDGEEGTKVYHPTWRIKYLKAKP